MPFPWASDRSPGWRDTSGAPGGCIDSIRFSNCSVALRWATTYGRDREQVGEAGHPGQQGLPGGPQMAAPL